MIPVWQIKFVDGSGTPIEVCGSEEVLRTAFDEAVAGMEALSAPGATDSAAKKLIRIEGFTDGADRAEATLVILVDTIAAMYLFRVY